ncbi:hypothetical protein UC35_21770 [Ramlibacter tataouinensis]|uniref:Uncharacterized protein n=1 Tax=Ramlibacter tataouinensis TaxID=94132 RepID=A0A140HLC0_9BURK|nr:hypothetical protein UC35_21770 [Ramlibacter tataouinensis]
MSRADKAALRLAIGTGLATFVAYGMALQTPYLVCILAVLLLCKPGPPLPMLKAVVLALVLALLVAGGVLMVPLLEHHAATGLLITASLLFILFYAGRLKANPLTTVLVLAFTLVPVAGVAEQALVGKLSVSFAVGVLVGSLVSALSAAVFPDPPSPAPPARATPSPAAARWIALRGMLIVMPVFVLALTNPSFYLAAIMKTVALGQQAGETDARSAGRELVGSTLTGALIAGVTWSGLSLWPSLWMLVLWAMAAALWAGSALFGARRTRYPPSYWSNALITAWIFFGPAVEDSASGKSVLKGAAMRATLFVGVALYAWAMVWALERWRARRQPGAASPFVLSKEDS